MRSPQRAALPSAQSQLGLPSTWMRFFRAVCVQHACSMRAACVQQTIDFLARSLECVTLCMVCQYYSTHRRPFEHARLGFCILLFAVCTRPDRGLILMIGMLWQACRQAELLWQC